MGECSRQEDSQVRCLGTPAASQETSAETDIEALKAAVKEAERDVDLAERALNNKKLRLKAVQNQLQDAVIAGVGGLKLEAPKEQVVKKPAPPKDEATRKAEVRRRWRILGMRIKFGLGAQALAVKRRNLKDAESFIDKESEEASKEDQLDLEGKCMRRKMDKRHFRRGGINVGSTQGRDGF